MINRIWGIKQLRLQVNGHAWFHLYGFAELFGTEKKRKKSKLKYMSPVGFEPTPRHSATSGHGALKMICRFMSYRIVGYKLIKPVREFAPPSPREQMS